MSGPWWLFKALGSGVGSWLWAFGSGAVRLGLGFRGFGVLGSVVLGQGRSGFEMDMNGPGLDGVPCFMEEMAGRSRESRTRRVVMMAAGGLDGAEGDADTAR